MRTILIVALLLTGTALVAAAPVATAHTCDLLNARCMAECLAHAFLANHTCSVYGASSPNPLP